MKKLIFILATFWVLTCIGQNKRKDDFFLTKRGIEDLDYDLKVGYRAFIIDSGEITSGNKRTFRNFVDQNNDHIVLFLQNRRSFCDSCEDLSFIENPSTLDTPSTSIMVFTSKGMEDLLNIFEYREDSLRGSSLCKTYNLVRVDSINNPEEAKTLVKGLTQDGGVIPHFVVSPYFPDFKKFKELISHKRIYQARVLLDNNDLPNVGWKEFSRLESCGLFSTISPTLTPQKRGFMFSPDIYNFTDKHSKNTGPKIFRAIKYELEEKLRYWLPLRGDFKNIVRATDKSTSTDIRFSEDEERGIVANFNGNGSYIDIRNREGGSLDEISITAWVKPSRVDGRFSLVGKGEAFSAKIFYGKLQFTTPGIKDHTTSNAFVKPGVWSHIAFVYVPGGKVYFYLNGKLVEELPASDIEQTGHALLIGTNLWGQYYAGAMSDLKIWDRALNDAEVKQVYQAKISSEESSMLIPGLLSVTGLIFLMVLIFILKRKWRSKGKISEKAKMPANMPAQYEIMVLNNFKIVNLEGMDITHKFSPKRRELFLLILLYTLKEGGINSRKMSGILWPGFSASSKKNNRSTHLKEIRKILEGQLPVEISIEDKKWKLKPAANVKIDIFELQHIFPGFLLKVPAQPDKNEILRFSRVVLRGPMLPGMETEWLDKVKAEYNNAVLDVLTPFIGSSKLSNTENIMVINAVLVIDPLYEPAVEKKIEYLKKDGKFGLAKKTEDHYRKLYKSYYDQAAD